MFDLSAMGRGRATNLYREGSWDLLGFKTLLGSFSPFFRDLSGFMGFLGAFRVLWSCLPEASKY